MSIFSTAFGKSNNAKISIAIAVITVATTIPKAAQNGGLLNLKSA